MLSTWRWLAVAAAARAAKRMNTSELMRALAEHMGGSPQAVIEAFGVELAGRIGDYDVEVAIVKDGREVTP